jgi:hypothetical protein
LLLAFVEEKAWASGNLRSAVDLRLEGLSPLHEPHRLETACVDGWEAIMFDFVMDRRNLAPRKGLYCVWIRANENENNPLMCIWIDSSMTILDVGEELRETEFAALPGGNCTGVYGRRHLISHSL